MKKPDIEIYKDLAKLRNQLARSRIAPIKLRRRAKEILVCSKTVMGFGGSILKEGSNDWLLAKVGDKHQRKEWRHSTISSANVPNFVRQARTATTPRLLLLPVCIPHMGNRRGSYDAEILLWHQCAAVANFQTRVLTFYNPWSREKTGSPLPGMLEVFWNSHCIFLRDAIDNEKHFLSLICTHEIGMQV